AKDAVGGAGVRGYAQERKFMGIPFLRPWANRLDGLTYRADRISPRLPAGAWCRHRRLGRSRQPGPTLGYLLHRGEHRSGEVDPGGVDAHALATRTPRGTRSVTRTR